MERKIVEWETRTNPLEADLTRHAVIEASAGTGKTYTIEQLVVRLLTEGRNGGATLGLRDILVVTFTEKAAGEMRERIRLALTEALAQGKGDARHLARQINAFDEAMIATIHGFCKKTLDEFAFECGLPFQQEVIKEGDLLLSMLRRVYREEWLTAGGEGYLQSLAGCDQKLASWQKVILKRAESDEVLPCVCSYTDLEAAGQALLDLFERAMDLLKPYSQAIGLYLKETKTPYNSNQYKAVKKIWQAIYSSLVNPLPLAARTERTRLVVSILNLVTKHSGTASTRTFADLDPCEIIKKDQGKETRRWPEIVPNLDAVIAAFEKLRTAWLEFRKNFDLATIQNIRQRATAEKRIHGLTSFDDMIRTLEREVREHPRLAASLRQRYRVAMIDEFQDTDALQWSIFKNIFVADEARKSGHVLFLIGDPKQAIYGFRGGDVATYMRACQELLACGGLRYSLDTNWRSRPEFVAACNRLFASDDPNSGWFSKLPGGGPWPGFAESRSPDMRRSNFIEQKASPPPIVIMPYDEEYQDALHWQHAGEMSREIERIVTDRVLPEVLFAGEEQARPLGYGDIAILVRSHAESIPIMRALHSRTIPYVLYKNGGLWCSDEALACLALFDALASPDEQAVRLALVTPFFDVSWSGLESAMQVESRQRRRLDRWRDQAGQGNWQRLFCSIERESGIHARYQTRHLAGLHEGSLDQRDWERRSANLRQILSSILLDPEVVGKSLDHIAESVRLKYFKAAEESDDEDIQPLESEGGKVRLMTMHVSKGMQFPIVFLGGGFSANSHGKKICYEYYTDDDFRVRDYEKKDKHKPYDEGYWQAETERLLYVAATRAILRVYFPVPSKGKSPLAGRPLGPALARVLAESSTGFIFIADERKIASKASVPSKLAGTLVKQGDKDSGFPDRFNAPPPPVLRAVFTDSFSAMKHLSHHELESGEPLIDTIAGLAAIDLDGKTDDDTGEIAESVIEPPEIQGLICLPRGPASGTSVHAFFEDLDFARGQTDKEYAKNLITDTVRKNRLRAMPGWMKARGGYQLKEIERDEVKKLQALEAERWLSSLLDGLLPTPISLAAGASFCLGDVRPADCLREIAFDEANPVARRRGWAPVMTGIIDLIFRHKGLYYVLDWKTNWLETYERPGMQNEMVRHGYDLQAAIYGRALSRWLGRQGLGPENFGGAVYVFVRAFTSGKYFESAKETQRCGDEGIFFMSAEFLDGVAARSGMEEGL